MGADAERAKLGLWVVAGARREAPMRRGIGRAAHGRRERLSLGLRGRSP